MNNNGEQAGGHVAMNYGNLVAETGWQGATSILRQGSDPVPFRNVFAVPPKQGKVQWQTASHYSWNHSDRRFFFLSSYTALATTNWVLVSGLVYQSPNWLKTRPNQLAPEGVRYKGPDLQRSNGIPTGPGQWFYDAAADALFVWPTDGADLTKADGRHVIAYDWRPFQDEIVQVWIDDQTNTTKARRLAHHQSRPGVRDPYRDQPHAASDWSGRFVMFTSNWGGRDRTDVFILQVPPEEPATAKAGREREGR